MMLILTVLAVLAVLVVSELWWYYKRPHDEISRKFVHITVGCFAAFWPYFLTRNEILFLSLAFIIVVLASLYLGIFKAIHSVERSTWGEVSFAIAVGTLAVVAPMPIIYTAALLHMSLSDGLAGLVGTAYGKNNGYKILGHKKSIVGSLTFLISSLAILAAYASAVADPPHFAVLAGIALGAMFIENVAIRGLDNIAVPLFVAVVLMSV